jgi:transcriptional regulator GlxA family with amidase domain
MADEPVAVVFPLFDGMTTLDFVAPYQVFTAVPSARVTAASLGGRDVHANGLVLTGLADLSRVETCDVICVPGGFGTAKVMVDEAFMREIRRLARGARYHTSVCTGALVLGAAGLLRGKRAATYWASRDTLKLFGATVEPGRVVRDGGVITGGGVTAGLDFALAVVAEIFGRPTAELVQLRLEYAPEPPFEAVHPDRAPASVTDRLRGDMKAGLAADHAAAQEAARRLHVFTS